MNFRFHVIGNEIRMDGVLVGTLVPLQAGVYEDVRKHIEGPSYDYDAGYDAGYEEGYDEAKDKYYFTKDTEY